MFRRLHYHVELSCNEAVVNVSLRCSIGWEKLSCGVIKGFVWLPFALVTCRHVLRSKSHIHFPRSGDLWFTDSKPYKKYDLNTVGLPYKLTNDWPTLSFHLGDATTGRSYCQLSHGYITATWFSDYLTTSVTFYDDISLVLCLAACVFRNIFQSCACTLVALAEGNHSQLLI